MAVGSSGQPRTQGLGKSGYSELGLQVELLSAWSSIHFLRCRCGLGRAGAWQGVGVLEQLLPGPRRPGGSSYLRTLSSLCFCRVGPCQGVGGAEGGGVGPSFS